MNRKLQRMKKLKHLIIILDVMVIITVFCFAYLKEQQVISLSTSERIMPLVIFAVVLSIIVTGIILIYYTKLAEQNIRHILEDKIQLIKDYLGSEAHFVHDQVFEKHLISQNPLLDKGNKRVTMNHSITHRLLRGCYQDCAFEIGNLETIHKEKTRDSDGECRTERETIFKGSYMVLGEAREKYQPVLVYKKAENESNYGPEYYNRITYQTSSGVLRNVYQNHQVIIWGVNGNNPFEETSRYRGMIRIMNELPFRNIG